RVLRGATHRSQPRARSVLSAHLAHSAAELSIRISPGDSRSPGGRIDRDVRVSALDRAGALRRILRRALVRAGGNRPLVYQSAAVSLLRRVAAADLPLHSEVSSPQDRSGIRAGGGLSRLTTPRRRTHHHHPESAHPRRIRVVPWLAISRSADQTTAR